MEKARGGGVACWPRVFACCTCLGSLRPYEWGEMGHYSGHHRSGTQQERGVKEWEKFDGRDHVLPESCACDPVLLQQVMRGNILTSCNWKGHKATDGMIIGWINNEKSLCCQSDFPQFIKETFEEESETHFYYFLLWSTGTANGCKWATHSS